MRHGGKRKLENEGGKKKREIPLKCRRCAMMLTPQVQELHGEEGDGCYNPKRCPQLRYYIRNREQVNLKRRVKGEDPVVVTRRGEDSLSNKYFAILIRYQELRHDSPLHAIEVQIWKGMDFYCIVEHEFESIDGTIKRHPAIHCLGLTPSQIYNYAAKILSTLEEQLGIKKFESEERQDPTFCPIRPCPHHPVNQW